MTLVLARRATPSSPLRTVRIGPLSDRLAGMALTDDAIGPETDGQRPPSSDDDDDGIVGEVLEDGRSSSSIAPHSHLRRSRVMTDEGEEEDYLVAVTALSAAATTTTGSGVAGGRRKRKRTNAILVRTPEVGRDRPRKLLRAHRRADDRSIADVDRHVRNEETVPTGGGSEEMPATPDDRISA